jgi:2-methylisocitrate lyase-like PEP mutase family enzyme
MNKRQRNWKALLKKHAPLLLPAACDALTAKLIQDAGFVAYQIGGFAVDGTRMAFPDMDVTRLGEKSVIVRDIVHASDLPVLVDCDDGYGDPKNVTHTVHTYDEIGASAIFIEDQKSPKRCGHMAGKEVIPVKEMLAKIHAAVEARADKRKLFLLARTDALQPEGMDEALRRAERYLKAGADGVWVEGPGKRSELEHIGREFRGEPLAVTILEGGGKTPWLPPDDLHAMGFSMLLYPTTILFRLTRSIQCALRDLRAGSPMPQAQAVTLTEFEKIVDIAYWKSVEQQSIPLGERLHQAVNSLFKRVA